MRPAQPTDASTRRVSLRDEVPGALTVVVGVVLLRVALLSSDYQRYVKVSARPLLVLAGFVLIGLGGLGMWRAHQTARAAAGHRVDADLDPHGHGTHAAAMDGGHAHVPATALLLLVPVVAVFAVSPPALGSYAAARAQTKILAKHLHAATSLPPAVNGVIPLTLDDFVQRTSVQENLTVGRFGLTGFVTKDPVATQGEFDLTRITIVCCAADAQTTVVAVAGVANPPPVDSWVRVVGSEVVVDGVPELNAISMQRVSPPHDPYAS